jgi:hypothetical protein
MHHHHHPYGRLQLKPSELAGTKLKLGKVTTVKAGEQGYVATHAPNTADNSGTTAGMVVMLPRRSDGELTVAPPFAGVVDFTETVAVPVASLPAEFEVRRIEQPPNLNHVFTPYGVGGVAQQKAKAVGSSNAGGGAGKKRKRKDGSLDATPKKEKKAKKDKKKSG